MELSLYEETSQDSLNRVATADSKLMVLIDFVEHIPTICLMSHIIRPSLGKAEDDASLLVASYIKTQRNLGIRWLNNGSSSSWHITQIPPESLKHSVIRAGKAIVISDDKDYLKAQRNELMATLHSKNDARVKVPLLEVAKDSSQVAEKRTYEDLEQENHEFYSKIRILEQDAEASELELKSLKARINELEENNPSTMLAKEMRQQIESLKQLNENRLVKIASVSNKCNPTAGAGAGGVTITEVKLNDEIMIRSDVLKQAIMYGRSKTGTVSRRLTSTIKIFLSSWYTEEELAQMCLSGLACPSIKGSMAKQKFPIEILDAIYNFLLPKWEDWHKIVLTQEQVKKAVGSILLAYHTNLKKRDKQTVDDVVGDDCSSPSTPTPSTSSEKDK